MITKSILTTTGLIISQLLASQTYRTELHTDKNGYRYEKVTNDPTGLRLYTLKNGMKVYLAQNFDEPRIQYYMGIRAGSAHDPADNTGLAHYLEHLLFNGTDSIGTTDWTKEEPLLDEITRLYEEHKSEKNDEKKRKIFERIDSFSVKALKYGIKSEYRRLVTSLGGVAINGFTNLEQTGYVTLIPSTALEKFLQLESNRFSRFVPRAFHTELEIVYEEFNREQDNTFKNKFYAISDALYKVHPYGTQKVIGTAAHLKNPSINAIREYFNKYYVPNNMAIVLVGDLEFDKTIQNVDRAFGRYPFKKVERPVFPREEPISESIERNIFSQDEESVYVGFRFDGAKSTDEKYLTLLDVILANGVGGLFDTDLNAVQKLKRAGSSLFINQDYGVQYLDGYPKSGQSLREVKSLMLEQIERIKKGDFENDLIKAAVNYLKRTREASYSSRSGMAFSFFSSFIRDESWGSVLSFVDEVSKISKQDIIDFAKRSYKNSYAVVYKNKGAAQNLVKVEKPKITPTPSNDEKKSIYGINLLRGEIPATSPEFIDFKKEIKFRTLKNSIPIASVHNSSNNLFELDIIFDATRNNSREIVLARDFISFMLGTTRYSAAELRKEFFKLGLVFDVLYTGSQTRFHIEGLQESIGKGIRLLDDIFSNPSADPALFDKFIKSAVDRMEALKTNKSYILHSGLVHYTLYGETSPLRNVFSREELLKMKLEGMLDFIRGLRNYNHRIFYYGNKLSETIDALNKYYKTGTPKKEFENTNEKYSRKPSPPVIYFVDFDMVQAEVLIISRGEKLNHENLPFSNMYNRYIEKAVFQKIREERSLAYSAYGSHFPGPYPGSYDYADMYAGTQADKLTETVGAMAEMMKQFPSYQNIFELAKKDQLKRYEAERLRGTNIYWTYEAFKRQAIDYDIRATYYNRIKSMTLEDMRTFFEKNIGNNSFSILILGNKKDIDMKALSQFGEVKEMDIAYLLNFR